MKTLGQINFERYWQHRGVPPEVAGWGGHTPEEQKLWEVSAQAVAEEALRRFLASDREMARLGDKIWNPLAPDP
jgi:hypothetical protein